MKWDVVEFFIHVYLSQRVPLPDTRILLTFTSSLGKTLARFEVMQRIPADTNHDENNE